jgi:ABC-2 type transport system ATP-binding protein
MSLPILHIENLVKSYPGLNRQVLSGLCLTIGRGEIYGFLGPNGAGKTTTVSILSGLLSADSGRMEMFGRPCEENRKYIKQHLGLVPQNIAIFPELTAYENLKIFGAIYGMDSKALKIRIEELLGLFGLMAFKDKKVASFSGGMKRSVNLMVGILHKPELLILDEPTVGIDVQSKVVILENLKSLNKEGVTILYTSHDMEEAQHLCTRVGIIDGGKLVAEDTPEGLIAAHQGCEDLEAVYLRLTGRKLRNMED